MNSHDGLWNAPTFYVRPQIAWRYQAGDWVIEPGIPDHHLRIAEQRLDESGSRQYVVFDARPNQLSGYGLRNADELERKSKLNVRPQPHEIPAVMQRTQRACGLKYSVLGHTECESLQRWIQTGDEKDRWSPQLLLAIRRVGSLPLRVQLSRGDRNQRWSLKTLCSPRAPVYAPSVLAVRARAAWQRFADAQPMTAPASWKTAREGTARGLLARNGV